MGKYKREIKRREVIKNTGYGDFSCSQSIYNIDETLVFKLYQGYVIICSIIPVVYQLINCVIINNYQYFKSPDLLDYRHDKIGLV